jgi:hypothetical protein
MTYECESTDFLVTVKGCHLASHEECKDQIMVSCFTIDPLLKNAITEKKRIKESSNLDKDVTGAEIKAILVKSKSSEAINTSNDLFSNMTLNDNNLEKMEEVMMEIIDSEVKYTEDMNFTSKVFFAIFN